MNTAITSKTSRVIVILRSFCPGQRSEGGDDDADARPREPGHAAPEARVVPERAKWRAPCVFIERIAGVYPGVALSHAASTIPVRTARLAAPAHVRRRPARVSFSMQSKRS